MLKPRTWQGRAQCFFSSLLTMDSASFHGLSMDYPWDLMTFLAVFGYLWSSFFWSIQLLWQRSITSRGLAQDDDRVLAAGKFPEHWDGEILGFPGSTSRVQDWGHGITVLPSGHFIDFYRLLWKLWEIAHLVRCFTYSNALFHR